MATLLVNAGKALVTSRIHGTGSEPLNIGVGSAAGTTAATDTTLFTEYTSGTWAGYARASGTGSQQTTTVTNDTYQVQGTLTAPSSGGPYAVTNAGNFDAASAGNMFVKGDFATINLNANDSIQLTIKVQFT